MSWSTWDLISPTLWAGKWVNFVQLTFVNVFVFVIYFALVFVLEFVFVFTFVKNDYGYRPLSYSVSQLMGRWGSLNKLHLLPIPIPNPPPPSPLKRLLNVYFQLEKVRTSKSLLTKWVMLEVSYLLFNSIQEMGEGAKACRVVATYFCWFIWH